MASLALVNSTLPFHLMYAGGLTVAELSNLKADCNKWGIVFEDYTFATNLLRRLNDKTKLTSEEALKRKGRMHLKSLDIQYYRSDNAGTLLKFYAYLKEKEWDRILYIDLDMKFREVPDFYLQLLSESSTSIFLADKQRHGQKTDTFWGLQCHTIFLKPNRTLFYEFFDRTEKTLYIPYTNGEQDVLEYVYSWYNFHPRDRVLFRKLRNTINHYR